MDVHAAPLTAVSLPAPGTPSMFVAPIPPDPSLPPGQRNWHERFPYRDYVELAADKAAVPSARHRLRLSLREWGLHHLLDDAELVVTEVVANAVNATCSVAWAASRPPVRMWARAGSGILYVLVWDACGAEPVLANAGVDDETGRGLLFVEAYSRWGLYHPPGDGAGKVIWTRFPKPPGEPAAFAI
jgi:anti-sigma regulatory factor (Ser/Thr protein kinase)